MTSQPRGLRRVFRIFTTFALTVGLLVPLTFDASASVPQPCGVKNLRTGRSYRGTGSNLQTAIDAAGPGSHLRIRGLCRGTFSIDRSLTLIGDGTAAYPAATLDGRRAGTVLTINGAATKVSLESLTLTRGVGEPSPGRMGGGIKNRGVLTLTDSTIIHNEGYLFGGGVLNTGTLTLNGSSAVTHNHVEGGGAGIANFRGTLTLNGASSVSNNVNVEYDGAGIYNIRGTIVMNDSSVIGGNVNAGGYGGGLSNERGGIVTMNDSSSVRENRTLEGGGAGIVNRGTLTMNDSSSVSSNVVAKSGYDGGGIENGSIASNGGTLTMNGTSSVTENSIVGPFGGGIDTVGGTFDACTTWTGAISPNSPDDPPTPTIVTC